MKKLILLGTILLIFSVATVIVILRWKSFAFENYERVMVKGSSEALIVMQESFKKEFGKYSTDSVRINQILSMQGVSVYTSTDEIPDSIRDKITFETELYLKEDDYRILLVIKSEHFNESSAWVLRSNNQISKIY